MPFFQFKVEGHFHNPSIIVKERRRMNEIKAIPTEYKGYLFRSRLEARWAVFFDAMGIEYEYESEGLVLSDGSWYLPDFYNLIR